MKAFLAAVLILWMIAAAGNWAIHVAYKHGLFHALCGQYWRYCND